MVKLEFQFKSSEKKLKPIVIFRKDEILILTDYSIDSTYQKSVIKNYSKS